MKCFNLEIADSVAHISFIRPEKRNSMIREFWEELPALVNDIDAGSKARVIVLSSTGPHFTSGIDVSLFGQLAASDAPDKKTRDLQANAAFYDQVLRLQGTFSALEEARIPVLAAVQGGCIGGGLDLVTACDMRYATKDAFFSLFETNLAMTADVGTFPRLAKLIPEGFVKEMAYTGGNISAHNAYRFGLVNEIYDTHEEIVEAVLAMSKDNAKNAPLAVHCKKLINYSRDHTTADKLDYIAIWNAANLKCRNYGSYDRENKEERRSIC